MISAEAAIAAYRSYRQTGAKPALDALGISLQQLNAGLSERLAEATLDRMRIIKDKIARLVPLLPDEKELVRLWILGDTETYLASENDFEAWRGELDRLMKEITGKPQPQTPAEIAAVKGAVNDALHLLPNITGYLALKQRRADFTGALDRLDAQGARYLLGMIEEKFLAAKGE